MFQMIRFFRALPKKKHMTLGVLACALWTSAVHADDYSEVNRLLKAGQPAEALSKADQYLNSKPRDPQMRFLKGVILAETGKTSEAIQTFVKLTEDYPELPEPYNNLAVLYASQSQFEKARVALEMAIRTNPSYATAHENLGDVYAKLASQSYSKALQLDGSNTGVPTKLALIRNLFAPDSRAIKTATQPTAAAPARTTPANPTTSAAQTVPPVAISASAPPEKSVPATSAEAPEITAAIQAWAKAWAGKDMNAYFAAYSSQFKPADGKTRKAWETDRQARILSKNSIPFKFPMSKHKSAETKPQPHSAKSTAPAAWPPTAEKHWKWHGKMGNGSSRANQQVADALFSRYLNSPFPLAAHKHGRAMCCRPPLRD